MRTGNGKREDRHFLMNCTTDDCLTSKDAFFVRTPVVINSKSKLLLGGKLTVMMITMENYATLKTLISGNAKN